ncbi:MAG: EamA-like transporter family protein [Synergistetes bacterium ADurb.Bin520]|nr:MAG: EamA-like transporter family protein [Synergistetes bacterium ADurb.Bin520]
MVFPTVMALLIQNTAQRYTPSTHVSILLSLESLFGALAGVFLLGEHLSEQMILGCAFIFAAVLLTEVDPMPLVRRLLPKTDAAP